MTETAWSPCVVVVGSTMIDMIAYVDRVPEAGETAVGDRFTQGFGGKGANQAVMAARLGAVVRMVNCLGTDALGDITIDNFIREGIDVTYVTRTDRASSGVAPIWVEADGTNRIVCVPGANNEMTTRQARSAVVAAERVDVVVGQFEVPQAVTAAGFAIAKDRGALTVLNPAPAYPLDSALMKVTDWLVPNEVELLKVARTFGLRPGRVDDELAAAVTKATGLKLAVTLGPHGVAICEDGVTVTRVAAPRVHAVDTTGAGDAFVGAFAYGLAEGLGARAAAELGCACASVSVTGTGTQTSFPNRTEVSEIRRGLRLAQVRAADDTRYGVRNRCFERSDVHRGVRRPD